MVSAVDVIVSDLDVVIAVDVIYLTYWDKCGDCS